LVLLKRKYGMKMVAANPNGFDMHLRQIYNIFVSISMRYL